MKVILLAAGYATRMYPLTKEKPKALLPIGDKPVMEYILDKLKKINITDVTIVSNNKFFSHFSEWARDKDVDVINDNTNSNEDRLGSVGDLQFVIDAKKIDDDVLIINADNFFSFDLHEIFDFFKQKNSVVTGAFDVKDVEQAKKKGNIQVDKNNKITFFKEKNQELTSTLSAIGIFFFSQASLPKIKEYIGLGKPADRFGDLIEWLYKEQDVFAFTFTSGYCYDIGSLELYARVKKKF